MSSMASIHLTVGQGLGTQVGGQLDEADSGNHPWVVLELILVSLPAQWVVCVCMCSLFLLWYSIDLSLAFRYLTAHLLLWFQASPLTQGCGCDGNPWDQFPI